MTSYRQLEANGRNALRSTGPRTEAGRLQSRRLKQPLSPITMRNQLWSRNAVRHGLTAETVIGSLEDAEDYSAGSWYSV